MTWARTTRALLRKPVIWIDGAHKVRPGHLAVARPVQWPALPALLTKAVDGHRAVHAATIEVTAPHPDFRPAHHSLALPRNPDAAAVAGRVLVVDGSDTERAHTRNLLQAEGYTVVEADSGHAALDRLSIDRVACVFIDAPMPGLDGYDTCHRIKSRARGLAGVPVVMLTSPSAPFDRPRAKVVGCDGHLVKPVEAHALRDILRAALARLVVPTDALVPGAALQPV